MFQRTPLLKINEINLMLLHALHLIFPEGYSKCTQRSTNQAMAWMTEQHGEGLIHILGTQTIAQNYRDGKQKAAEA